jgi:hypothetical protein
MALSALLVSEVTRQRLGDDGLFDLAACLWPVDCQSCGRFLGDDPPVLFIDDLAVQAIASLHHQRCRPPAWNDSMTVIAGSGQYTTFVARMLLVPVINDHRFERAYPLMVVNPGLECVHLQRAQNGSWQLGHSQALAGAGLVQPGSELRLGVPADGLVTCLTELTVTVVVQIPPFTVYEAPADERILDRARALGGVLTVVTHRLNPGDFTLDELGEALADPRTLAGWAGLHGTRHEPPRRRFRLRAEVLVLHWNSDHLSVGKLVRQAPGRFTADSALSWAERVMGAGPLAWQPVHDDRPDEGWHTGEPYSGRQHVLRRHADGWKLVQAYSQASGTTVETDNEAKARAAQVLKLQAGISGLTWQPGPSTPDSVTWYGIAR